MLDIYEATGSLSVTLECLDGEGAYDDVVVEVVAEVEYEHESYDCPASVQYKIVSSKVYYDATGDEVSQAALDNCCFTLYRPEGNWYTLKSYKTVEELLDKAAAYIDWE